MSRPTDAPLAGLRVVLLESRPVPISILSEMLTSWEARLTEQTGDADLVLTTSAGLEGIVAPPLPLVVMHRLDQAAALGPAYAASRVEWLLAPVRSERLLDALLRLRQPAPAPSRPRILVAEDNPVSQRVATAMLQLLGYVVDVVPDGAQAIASWREQSYDVILMGCQMPGLDGFATAAAIREEETHGRRIPIIALSSEDSREIARSSPESMDGYLNKPVSLDQLRVALERYVTPNEQPSNARPADPVRSLR